LPVYNWQVDDWGEFKEALTARIEELPFPISLLTEYEFQGTVHDLMAALQDTIHKSVLKVSPSPHSKLWWSKALSALKKKKNKLSAISYNFCAMPCHHSHSEHQDIQRLYIKEILVAKQDPWATFLEGMSYSNIWTVNKYISGDRDGSKTRVLMLTFTTHGDAASSDVVVTSNKKK